MVFGGLGFGLCRRVCARLCIVLLAAGVNLGLPLRTFSDGLADELLHERGAIDTSLPFEELKRIVGFPEYYVDEARYDTTHKAHVPNIPPPMNR